MVVIRLLSGAGLMALDRQVVAVARGEILCAAVAEEAELVLVAAMMEQATV